MPVELRRHQKIAFEGCKRGLFKYTWHYLIGEVRTGKTLVALFLANLYLGNKGGWCLFVTTLNAKPGIKKQFAATGFKWQLYLTTYKMLEQVPIKPRFVIYDEAHMLGAYPKPSLRAKIARRKFANIPTLLMSGTASPESFSQLFHQVYVIGVKGLWFKYKNFYKWFSTYGIKEYSYIGNERPITSYKITEDRVMEEFKPHTTTMTQKDAGFDGGIIEVFHTLTMPDNLRSVMRDVLKQGFNRPSNIVGDSAARSHTLIHQLASGTYIDDDKQRVVISRYKARYILDEFVRKKQRVAIFYVFIAEGEMLKAYFPNWTNDQDVFERTGRPFIIQIVSGREGVDVKTADALIYFNMHYSAVCYWQGRSRSQSIDGGDKYVHFLLSDYGPERDIYLTVAGKKDFTLDHFKTYVRKLNTN